MIPNKAGVNRESDSVHECGKCRGKRNCIHFKRIIHTSEVVGYVSDDEDDEDDYETDEDAEDYDEDGYYDDDYYGEYDSEGHYQDEDDLLDYWHD